LFVIRQDLQLDSEIDLANADAVRHVDHCRSEVQDARDTRSHQRIGCVLSGEPRCRDDADRDVPRYDDLREFRQVSDTNATNDRTDLGFVDIDNSADRESTIAESVVTGQRLAHVASTNDDDRPIVGESELATDLVHKKFDLVADTPSAIATEVAQVFAHLGSIDASQFGEFFGRNFRDVDVELLTEDAQVHRKTGDSCLRNSASSLLTSHALATLERLCTFSQDVRQVAL